MIPAERAARAVFDTFTTHDFESIRALVTDTFVDHGAPRGLPPGPDGYIGVLRFITGVLHLRYEVHDVVAAGDLVAVRATAYGVHNSDYLGVPKTGMPFTMPTMHLYRGEGDRLAEHWGVRDEFSVLVQVGALTPPSLADFRIPVS